MVENIYPFKKLHDFEYSFKSIGRKGVIIKIVTFEEIAQGIYNVLLQDEISGIRLGDNSITNNGDVLKVINTTATIIKDVLNNPLVTAIHIAGSSQQRNHIYQRRIVRELKDLIILGQQDEFAPFEPVNNEENYIAFLILSQ